jgi:glycerol-3-phosphate dehydrogenase (NAD(P)+)
VSERHLAVVGAGSWGTAIAKVLSGAGHDVRLWAYESEVVADIEEYRVNRTYLPDVPLPEGLQPTNDLPDAVKGAEAVVSVMPSQHVARVMSQAVPHLDDDAIVISASKGIELSTLRRMDDVFASMLTPGQIERFTVLSGPSFAAEVAREMPTAVVVASRSREARLRAQELFQTEYFRVYTNRDVVGVELGGALKNVIALAAGVAAGLGFGHNTRAALITRGLAEMTRLGVALGADRHTFAGLAGMGDLVLTCTGELSRNRTVGFRLGQGEALADILGHMTAVAEGVKTAQAVVDLAERTGVEMPISVEVNAILTEGRDPLEALRNLMLRDPKPEHWS